MGLWMTYWTWRAQFITVMQSTVRKHSPLVLDILQSSKMSTSLQKYVDVAHEMRGETVLPIMAPRQVKRGDELLWAKVPMTKWSPRP